MTPLSHFNLSLAMPLAGLYLGISVCTFLLYGWDKAAAQSGQWRVRESTLHVLGLLGGWPGALFAQKVFRHKSRKLSFKVVLWVTVVVNCSALALLLALANRHVG